MTGAGFTKIAVSLALNGLRIKGFLNHIEDADDYGNPFSAYSISEKGMKWLMDNQDRLLLQISSKPSKEIPTKTSEEEQNRFLSELDDDEIPF